MHVLGRKKGALIIAAAVMLVSAASPALLDAKPAPGYVPSGFRLFARASFLWTGNRVQCFLSNAGQICSPSSSTIGGANWPAGTQNQYVFNSGLQVAGRVDPNSVRNPWAGSIDGAFFFNARGGGNGQQITDIFNSADDGDLANWPTAAYVPSPPDPSADIYDPALYGLKAASDNDIWFLSWEGDPNLSAGRNHPLGLLVETRGMAYNTPGKNDFLFFIYTFYNITSGNDADYANAPARMQSYLTGPNSVGKRFQALQAANGDVLPAGGYTIQDMFLAFAADMDVAPVGNNVDNFASVNVPFSLGYTYHHSFTAPSSWTFDPQIYRDPFFPGSGFIGVKYLKSPVVNGQEVGLTLFGATTNGGEFSDPPSTEALYRYLTGNLDQSQGDDFCNVGLVSVTKICYINQGAADDMRFFQASGPLTLAPGEFSSIAVSYIFAAPVKSGACTGPDVCVQLAPQQPTGSLTRLTDPVILPSGANTIDSISGYLGWRDTIFTRKGQTVFANGVVDQEEFLVVPGSMLGKALTAQAVFDAKFVQPAPPKAPQFFLIPGDNQVTVVWQPSSTELDGDPYYSAAQLVANFDPNYRSNDVAGYRVYRGIRGAESSLQLLKQFDFAGDTMSDRTGQLNSIDAKGFVDCAPELGVFTSCVSAGNVNGVETIVPHVITLDGELTQYTGLVSTTQNGPVQGYATRSDTALSGGGNPLFDGSSTVALQGTGVPFVFVDKAGGCTRCGVRNHTQYFYMVTAFDINSIRSGPSSLESNRSGSRLVTPTPLGSNQSSSSNVPPAVISDAAGQPLPAGTAPTLDAQGRFSGPFQPANNQSLAFIGDLPSQIFSGGGTVTVRLDGIGMGDQRNGIPATYTFTAISSVGDAGTFSLLLDPTFADGNVAASALPPTAVAVADPALVGQYAQPFAAPIATSFSTAMPNYQKVVGQTRGCADGQGVAAAAGTTGCSYNGPRWFEGANETTADPNSGMGSDLSGSLPAGVTNFNNAGALTGVATIQTPMTHGNISSAWRAMDASLGGVGRAADFEVTWGNPGKIVSVMDVTHNVSVPFMRDSIGGGFGVLNVSGTNAPGSGDTRPTVLSLNDFSCVEPWRSGAAGTGARGQAAFGCTSAARFTLSDSAELNSIALYAGGTANGVSATPRPNGFILYIAGRISLFELSGPTLPTNTTWTLRSYTGWVSGGDGAGGPLGPYTFSESPRPFTALGASLQLNYSVTNTTRPPTKADLARVHTVPDPYYVTNAFEQSADNKVIKFVNLPSQAIIRIYSVSGVLVRTLEHSSNTSSEETWDVRNRNSQFVASGVYFYHIESIDARRIGRMTIVNFAK